MLNEADTLIVRLQHKNHRAKLHEAGATAPPATAAASPPPSFCRTFAPLCVTTAAQNPAGWQMDGANHAACGQFQFRFQIRAPWLFVPNHCQTKKRMCADWVSRSVEFSWLRCFDQGNANSNKQSFLTPPALQWCRAQSTRILFKTHIASNRPLLPAGTRLATMVPQDTLHHICFRQTMQVVRYWSRGFREHSVKFPQNQGGNHRDRYVPPQRPLRAKDAMVQQ